MNIFTENFIGTLLWSSGEEYDGFSIYDFCKKDLKFIEIQCDDFQEKTYSKIKEDLSRAGHDFALTRNGHGAGFWDGDWPVYGDYLTDVSESYGEMEIYIGDDGELLLGRQ